MRLKPFFDLVNERYHIYLQKSTGHPKPWTEDKILQSYRFCNVFREDDTVTKWVKEHIRDKFENEKLIFLVIAARLFNRISTLEILEPYFGDLIPKEKVLPLIKDVRPVVGSAYLTTTPKGFEKGEGTLEVMGMIRPYLKDISSAFLGGTDDGVNTNMGFTTLEQASEYLTGFKFIGTFLSYEMITDLRHTHVLEDATDIMTWAYAGPGCARGLSRIQDLPLDYYKYGTKKENDKMLVVMKEILEASRSMFNGPRWEMRDVEHCLCEFDKYERVKNGEGTPRQLYDGRL